MHNDVYEIDAKVVGNPKGKNWLLRKLALEKKIGEFLDKPPFNAKVQLDINKSVQRMELIDKIASIGNLPAKKK